MPARPPGIPWTKAIPAGPYTAPISAARRPVNPASRRPENADSVSSSYTVLPPPRFHLPHLDVRDPGRLRNRRSHRSGRTRSPERPSSAIPPEYETPPRDVHSTDESFARSHHHVRIIHKISRQVKKTRGHGFWRMHGFSLPPTSGGGGEAVNRVIRVIRVIRVLNPCRKIDAHQNQAASQISRKSRHLV